MKKWLLALFAISSTCLADIPNIVEKVSLDSSLDSKDLFVKTVDGDLYNAGVAEGVISDSDDVQLSYKKIMSGVKEIIDDGNCAITTSDDLYCWDMLHAKGIAGTPTKLLANVKEMVSFQENHCAITNNHDLYCWGGNSRGQVGNGTNISQSSPVKVLAGVREVLLADGNTCAITTADELYCWGRNESNQISLEDDEDRPTPVKVFSNVKDAYMNKAKVLRLRDRSICAITTSNQLSCWGAGFRNADVNPGSNYELDNIKEVSFGFVEIDSETDAIVEEQFCVLTKSKDLFCEKGKYIADKLVYEKPNPIVPILSNVKDFSFPELGNAVCATTEDDDLYCWGRNKYGQVGNGNTEDQDEPFKVLSGVSAFTVGFDRVCAIKTDKTLWCWGAWPDTRAGIINGAGSKVPVLLAAGVKDVIIKWNNHCYIEESGQLHCWGAIFGNNISCIADNDSDGDGAIDCNDECSADPLNVKRPEAGCFINGSDVPERYDPKLPRVGIVTPKTKLLPPFVLNKGKKATVYFERFDAGYLKDIVGEYKPNNRFGYEIRVTEKTKKPVRQSSKLLKRNVKKNNISLKLKKNTTYKVKYRVGVKSGKKTKYTRWTKAVTVKINNQK